MTALSDALTAAQRSALAALEKAYVAEKIDKVAACSHTVRGTRVQCQLPAGHEGDHIAPGRPAADRQAAGSTASDLLRSQLQETGSIPTGGGFDLAWLLLMLSDLGIDENAVFIDVGKRRIEVVR